MPCILFYPLSPCSAGRGGIFCSCGLSKLSPLNGSYALLIPYTATYLDHVVIQGVTTHSVWESFVIYCVNVSSGSLSNLLARSFILQELEISACVLYFSLLQCLALLVLCGLGFQIFLCKVLWLCLVFNVQVHLKVSGV